MSGFGRYVALGDSTTEGLEDPYPDGRGHRGWADRLAERLARDEPGPALREPGRARQAGAPGPRRAARGGAGSAAGPRERAGGAERRAAPRLRHRRGRRRDRGSGGSVARLWHPDRLHANPEGHARIADAAAQALGLPGASDAWTRPLPPGVAAGRRVALAADAVWFGRHVAPWVVRRLRGRSSGDGRSAKRPALEPVR